MGITTLWFFVFLFLSVIVYYVFPRKFRWITLLLSSLVFFLCASSYLMLIYMFFGILVTYVAAILIDGKFKENVKARKITLLLSMFFIIAQLSCLKYINIVPTTINAFASLFNINFHMNTINLIAPLGISYYTLSLISYVIDVYRTTSNAQKNFFKHALFTCYYPLMISGPIVRFEYMKDQLFGERKYDFKNILYGAQRIVYGLLKKMVVADQLAIVVKFIFKNYENISGFTVVLGVIFYAVQIYCDFSGCIDIVSGASKLYGVDLPRNFDSPFFSQNLSERSEEQRK